MSKTQLHMHKRPYIRNSSMKALDALSVPLNTAQSLPDLEQLIFLRSHGLVRSLNVIQRGPDIVVCGIAESWYGLQLAIEAVRAWKQRSDFAHVHFDVQVRSPNRHNRRVTSRVLF